jgi:uncharacterized membrane protein YeaQ/YmgE (transglycosylase-associated protein family)
MGIGFIIAILIWGFIIGGLARFAIPGPDPMPIWMTIAIGIGGSLIGGVVSRLVFGTAASFFFALLGAILLVALYRKYVQHRPIWGPDAAKPPPPR